MEEYLRVGVISNTHGVRGEVKIFSTTDDIRRFKKLKQAVIDTGRERIEVEVESCKFFKQTPILKFKSFSACLLINAKWTFFIQTKNNR